LKNKHINNLVVVGGGSAGWLTALYTKVIFPDDNVVLIESKEIGILGAGEASTPNLINALDFLGIPVSDLIKHTNATIKTTAKFTGWSNKNEDYFYHPFEYLIPEISEQNGYLDSFNLDTNLFHLYSYINNISMDEYCFINKICNNNKVPFTKITEFNNINPILNYNQLGAWSLNFDAKLLADYLSKVAQNRGIKRIESKVKEINLNQDEEISNLLLENGLCIDVDFVFDCTGFARLIIGKKYLSKWISYKDYLPTNKALPFFLNNKEHEKIPSYIEAIAMDYGWMWKTPLQNRYGCGYVFDNNQISVDDAKIEIENKLGFEIFPPKLFSFEPGTYKEIWIKNCLALGLSAGFVEPLEATSLMQTIFNLQKFFTNKHNILTKNKFIKDNFNYNNEISSFSIVEYIYWHYVTNKENTLFWKNFIQNTKTPELITNILEINKERILVQSDFFSTLKGSHFNTEDYLCVLFGHKLPNKQLLKKYKRELQYFNKTHTNLITTQNIQKTISHDLFLEDLKNNY
jgi:tryptophan halogenase